MVYIPTPVPELSSLEHVLCCAVSIHENTNEFKKAKDPENLFKVVDQAKGEQAATGPEGVGQQADDKGDTSAVDVADVPKIQQDRIGVNARSVGIRCLQSTASGNLDLACRPKIVMLDRCRRPTSNDFDVMLASFEVEN